MLITRSLAFVGSIIMAAATTSESCLDGAALPELPKVAYTALSVDGEVVGVPDRVRATVEASGLVPTQEDLDGAEREIDVDGVSIVFTTGLAPQFHAWVASAFAQDAAADVALILVSEDDTEISRIELKGSQVDALEWRAPDEDGNGGGFVLKATSHNAARSNRSNGIRIDPDGDGGDLDGDGELDVEGLPDELAAAISLEGLSLGACTDDDRMCGSSAHFIVAPEASDAVRGWMLDKAATKDRPIVSVTWNTTAGDRAAKLSMELDPASWVARADDGENPLHESAHASVSNPVYDGE